MNTLLLDALHCKRVLRPPVWLMRQAGRYMPAYQELRKKHSLWEMFHNSEIATAVTLLPLKHLGVDAAILFSDILVIAEALGLSIHFPNTGGPRIEPPIRTAEQVAALVSIPVEEVLHYVFETITHTKEQIAVPLIGFSGGPFTVASYLIDSTSQTAFERTKKWVREDPFSFHQLLNKITEVTISYLKGQIQAGADVIQIFDSWANVLDDEEFQLFSLPYLQQIVEALREMQVPVILFCRGSSLRAEFLSQLKPACISFDWERPLIELRKQVPLSIAVQGNFPPSFLKLSFEEIRSGVTTLIRSMEGQLGFIVNLGHGVTPDIPLENVQCFVDTVKSVTI